MVAQASRDVDIARLGLERHAEELDLRGLTVVPPDEAAPEGLADELLERIAEVATERNGGTPPDFETGSTHSEILSPTGQFLPYLLVEGQVFEAALMNPVALALMRWLVGADGILISASAMLKGPGRLPLMLHADQSIQQTTASLYSNATYALTDYTRENGCLCFVPGSHRLMRSPTASENFSFDPPRSVEIAARARSGSEVRVIDPPGAVPVEAPKGSLIVWHGNTWHGAYNRTAPGLRCNFIVGLCHPHLRPQEPYREMIPQEIIDRNDEEFGRVIGRDVALGWMSEGPEEPGVAFARARSRCAANAPAQAGEHIGEVPVPEFRG